MVTHSQRDASYADYVGIFSKWRKIEVVKWAEDAIYAPIQTTDDKNRSLR